MTDPLTIPAQEWYSLRVFALDLPRDKMDALIRPNPAPATDPLAKLFGVAEIDHGHVEIIDPADLGALGLSGYLTEGALIPAAQIAPDRDRLDARSGPVLILRSMAFDGRATILSPDPRLTLIGSYTEDRPEVRFEPLPTAMAQGTLNPVLPATAPTRPPRAFQILGAALLITGLLAVFLALR